MHEHGLTDIVINSSEPSGLPPVAVRPPHAHDSGYDCDDSRSPSRPIANFNGRKHENDSKENPMNNEIRKFDFKGATLRTLTDEAGEPWFVAKDVCDILGMSNPSMAVTALDKDEVAQIDPKDYLGSENRSNQAVNIVSEPGLYKLIMRSRKPEAKEFQRWVTHEVLPQIRRTGGYIPAGESDSDEDIMARAVLVAQKTIKQKNQQIAEQQTRIDELQPKASAWDNFVDIDDALSVRDSAKLLSNLGRTVGQTELFEWLDRHDWIFRENKHWSARQSRINAGHLMMVPPKSHGTHKDGTPFAFPPTVKVTRKGLALIARRFGEETLQLEYPKAGA
jgi:anti-repressor protein